jgi:hypothetical protein
MAGPFTQFAKKIRRTLGKTQAAGDHSFDGARYWQNRYLSGGNSGAGSYGQLANFKAEILNTFVSANAVKSVIEFGCGDGNQLSLAKYPRYLGLDVSRAAVRHCMDRFKDDSTKSFMWYDPTCFCNKGGGLRANLAMSLDVIFHLVEDDIYLKYLNDLFATSKHFVVIYSSNFERDSAAVHVRHRTFTEDVKLRFPEWELIQHVPNRFPETLGPENGSFADFFVYRKRGTVRE